MSERRSQVMPTALTSCDIDNRKQVDASYAPFWQEGAKLLHEKACKRPTPGRTLTTQSLPKNRARSTRLDMCADVLDDLPEQLPEEARQQRTAQVQALGCIMVAIVLCAPPERHQQQPVHDVAQEESLPSTVRSRISTSIRAEM